MRHRAGRITGPFPLADGQFVWLRQVRAEDAPRLVELCQRLSPLSMWRRFLRSTARCDPQEAERLASVDQVREVAVAAIPDPHADSPILAVGRFHGDGSDRAELAVVVDDAYQRLGLGRLLLQWVVQEAARRGLRTLDGYVLYDNQPMLRLLRSSGHPLEVKWDNGDLLTIKLDVRPPVGQGPIRRLLPSVCPWPRRPGTVAARPGGQRRGRRAVVQARAASL